MRTFWAFSSIESLRSVHDEMAALEKAAAEFALQHILDQVEQLTSLMETSGAVRDIAAGEYRIKGQPLAIAYRVRADAFEVLALLQGATVND